MPYVGNPLADAFSSREKQDLTGQSGTTFTLTHSVSHANDLSVYINHVRQEPTTAYTVNGTTLETTGTVAGTDDFYIIYDELALQSISHPSDQAMTATSGTFTSGLVGTTATFSGALSATTGTFSSTVDIQGQELILDADNDTSIKADTDDQIDFKAGNIIRASVISTGLQVGGTAYFASPTLTLKDPDSGVGAGTVGGKIDFHTMDSTATGVSATIKAKYEDTNGNTALAFDTGSGGSTSEKLRIASSGNVGIGVSPESAVKLEVNAGSDGAVAISARSDGGNGNNRRFNIKAVASGNGTYGGGLVLETRDNSNVFRETLRANYNRQLILGGSTADANGKITIKQAVSNGLGGMFIDTYAYYSNIPGINITNGDTNNARNMEDVEFHRNGGLRGYIRISHSGVSFTSNSDYRLKEDEKEITNAIEQIKKLKPYNFKWKNSDDRQDGFFAHEIGEVFDYVAQGEKDATQVKKKVVRNKDGFVIAQNIEKADWEKRKADADNEEASPKGETTYPSDSIWQEEYKDIKPQTIDNSKLVPILTAALQEAIKRIEVLESK